MKTAKVLDQIQAALEAKLNTAIAAEAADYGKPIPPITKFSQGFEDPMRLQKYNALMVCPDTVRNDRTRQIVPVSVDLVVAVKGSEAGAVMDTMKVYADALANLVEADPTIGGAVFEARFESAEFIGPTPGNGLIGVVIVRLTVDTDNLLQ